MPRSDTLELEICGRAASRARLPGRILKLERRMPVKTKEFLEGLAEVSLPEDRPVVRDPSPKRRRNRPSVRKAEPDRHSTEMRPGS